MKEERPPVRLPKDFPQIAGDDRTLPPAERVLLYMKVFGLTESDAQVAIAFADGQTIPGDVIPIPERSPGPSEEDDDRNGS